MILSFTILGNQEKPTGNPIPYHRTTQKGLWDPASKRYKAWKDYVCLALIDSSSEELAKGFKIRFFRKLKPIDLSEKRAVMNIQILWKNGSHGDCDNIWKGIADALFQNDKHVAGSFQYEYSGDKVGKVEVEIKINE